MSGLRPHRGVLILVLGIVSLVVCGPVGIASWVLGNADLRDMKAGLMDPTGESMTQAGRICGMIAVAFMTVGCCIAFGYLILFVLIAGAGAAGGGGP